jgi:hypothetical protein
MTNEQLPEWDNDPLERWEPTAAQRARAIELWHCHVGDDPDFAAVFDAYCADVLRERSLPQTLLAILRHGSTTMIGAQGQDLTLRRLAADLQHARADAAEEAPQ